MRHPLSPKIADEIEPLVQKRFGFILIGGFDVAAHFRRVAGRAEVDGAAVGERHAQAVDVAERLDLADRGKESLEIVARRAQMRHQGGAFFLGEILQTVGGGDRQIVGGGDLRQRLFLLG